MSRLWGGRRLGGRSGGISYYVIKALLVGIPIAWFVFALEMTVLSVDRTPHHFSERRAGAVLGQVFKRQLDSPHHNQPWGNSTNVPAQQKVLGNVIGGGVHGDSLQGGTRAPAKELNNVPGESAHKTDVAVMDGDGGNRKLNKKRLPIGLNEDRFAKRTGVGGGREEGVGGGGGGGVNKDGSVDSADVVASIRFDPPKMGEMGQPVSVDLSRLTWEERAQYDAGYSTHNFNQFVSDRVSLQRTVPDYRHHKCGTQQYSGRLYQASVIMCFYNEAWSTLLRSVHSVLDRSPPNLLKELILVDDFSDLEHLKTDLDNYMSGFPKVKILRMPERVGLVRARLRGVDVAQGPILIFLDSHVECGDGWIEPLVSEVSRNETVAVTPIIDIIDKDTMAVVQAVDSLGVVDLRHMTFIWSQLTPRIQAMRASAAHPFMSPTMAGGLFAINKKFFLQLGTWDPGLVLWGGENLELSFKMWMCGGAILIHPCSRVSHIFRDKSPYLKANVDRVVMGNAARVAEVWLDDYKRFFFRGEQYDVNVFGNVTDRKKLRESLSCKNFKWYIDNVYPEIFIDGVGKYMSHIMSATGLCLRFQDADRRALMLHEDCSGAEIWQSTQIYEIRNGPSCLEEVQGQIFASPCDSQQQSQAFEIIQQGPEVTILHVPTRLCMAAAEAGTMGILQLAPCLYGDRRQLWAFQKNPNLAVFSSEL